MRYSPFLNKGVLGFPNQRAPNQQLTGRWWQLKYFWNVQPDPWGNSIQFDEHMFQMGMFHVKDSLLRVMLCFMTPPTIPSGEMPTNQTA